MADDPQPHATPIPMVDLAVQLDAIRDEVEAGFRATMQRGQFVLGPNVAAFEREAADYLGVRHAVGCASGTDALHLALVAAGIGPGDEVITTPFSFFGTVEPILHAGARPVFADIDPATYALDPAGVEAAITPATRAILPVHLFGQPAATEPLLELARRFRLRLIEDCAQSFGATRGGRQTGSLGDAGCFSFFPSKNLGAFGDGGLVVTDSAALAARIRELGNHGSTARYVHRSVGWNSRLDEVQAVVLRAKLGHIDAWNAERRRLAARYGEALRNVPGLVTPVEDADGVHVYHQYTVLLACRDEVAAALRARHIDCAVHYPIPLHRQPALAGAHGDCELPVAEAVAAHCLSLPMYPGLGDDALLRVAAGLRNAMAAAGADDERMLDWPPAAGLARRAQVAAPGAGRSPLG
jgi:dTDP-4-amino-4,6-dideoxygalactose transaminase